ncbi:MAG: hypothetical protein ACFFEK_07340 [Candidatus Thorarchaeota archaeon]
MTTNNKEKILYIMTAMIIIVAVIIFFAWHNVVSGTFPFGLCSECHF